MSTPTLKELIEKATPGRWIADQVPTSIGRCFRVGSREQLDQPKTERKLPAYACLYDDWTFGAGDNQTSANAKLIARCSPETMTLVLEALEMTVAEIECYCHPEGVAAYHGPCAHCLSKSTLAALNGEERT